MITDFMCDSFAVHAWSNPVMFDLNSLFACVQHHILWHYLKLTLSRINAMKYSNSLQKMPVELFEVCKKKKMTPEMKQSRQTNYA